MSIRNISHPHPLKRHVQGVRLPLHEIRRRLGGSPSEYVISRALSGIQPMPEGLEEKLRGMIAEKIQAGEVRQKPAKRRPARKKAGGQ